MKFADLKLKSKIFIGLLIPLIFLIIQAAISINEIQNMLEDKDSVEHSNIVLRESEAIVAAAVDMETGMRGYLLAGQDEFLDPYRMGEAAAYGAFVALRVRISDNPSQVARLELAEQILRNWQRDVTEPIIARRQETGESATLQGLAEVMGELSGKEYFDRFRELMSTVIAAEEVLLIERSEVHLAAVTQTYRIIYATLLAATLFVFGLAWYLGRSIAEPIIAMTNTMLALAAGEGKRVKIPGVGRRDEVGRMAKALQVFSNAMEKIVEQNWVKNAFLSISDAMYSSTTAQAASREILNKVVPLLGGNQGLFYRFNKKEERLELLESYTPVESEHGGNSFELGEGLVGKCALEEKPIIATEVPDDHWESTSGLGSAAPTTIAAYPIFLQENLQGVIEIGSFNTFAPRQLQLLEDLMPSIALYFDKLTRGEKTEILLQKTIGQAEELKSSKQKLLARREELTAINNQLTDTAQILMNKTTALEKSEAELKTKSKEIRKSRDELEIRVEERTAALNESKKSAEAARMVVDTTLQNMSQGILMVDGEGKILQYNDKFLEYMDITKEQVEAIETGLELRALVSSTIGEVAVERSKQLAEQGGEASYDFKTRQGVHLDIRQNSLAVGGFVRTYTDISDRKKFELKLKKAISDAEAATEAKASFLASMSHEIRTPLNGVIGMVDLLQQSDLTSDQQQMMQTISESGAILIALINDILDFSKIESGNIELESLPISLVEVVEVAIQSLASTAVKKGLRLISYIDPGLPEYILGDSVRLHQIIVNLVSNAINFTEHGDVVIRAEQISANEDGKITVRFSVIDQGIGIAEEAQGILFQAFSQAETSTTRTHGGTGLGLAICKRLVELMNGEIGVNSKLGEGSEFYASISFMPSDKQLEKNRAEDSLSDLRILLVNSNPTEQVILRRYLEHWKILVESSDDLEGIFDRCLSAGEKGVAYDVVIFGSQWTRDKTIPIRDSLKEAGLKTQFVFLTQQARSQARQDSENKGPFVDVYPIRRATFISAVAIAAGKESPETQYEKVVEDISSSSIALSVEDALEQDSLILVAEDNAINRDVIGRQLKLLGYTFEMAEDGKIALEAWRNNRYALLLADCNMPIMDGYELTKAIRQDEEGTDTHAKIIAITANAMEGDAEHCLESGMDDYMVKPIDMDILKRILGKWLPQAKSGKTRLVKKTRKKSSKVSTAEKPEDDKTTSALVIDSLALTSVFGDDPDTIHAILSDFVRPATENVKEIEEAYINHTAEGIQTAAHKLKSSAGSVGATKLANSCLILEQASKESNWKELEREVPKLAGKLGDVLTYIKDL